MFQEDNDQQEQGESSQTSLPSIRQLFGIRSSDHLDALISPPQRAQRPNNPPPSAFPHQAVQAVHNPPRPPLERRLDTRTPVRSASFSSGQVAESHQLGLSTRGRLMSPRSASSSSVSPYASLPQQHSNSSRSPTVSRARQSPSNLTSTVALPPISTAIPGFVANRGRAVSDTEAFTRGGLTPSSGGRIPTPAPYSYRDSAAPLHPSLQHPRHSADPATIDQRGHIGRSPVQATSDAHYPSSGRSHAHSIVSQSSSTHSDEPAPSNGWTDRSRSSIEYSQTSSSHEYAPHPFSSASISARQSTAAAGNAAYPPIPVASTSAPAGSYTSEGSTHASPSRGAAERVPPSSFPHYGVYSSSSSSRPRSGNSSEGDESKGGFGKYECDYCSKRFNRPSSLRIHINTHTGAKPFQCPYPSCGRRFSVMSNMRRHARTHGNMLSLSAGEDPPPHPRGSGEGSSSGRSPRVPNGHAEASVPVDATGKPIKADPDVDMEADVDELENDYDDEMDYDGGAGSSESEGYPPRSLPPKPSTSDPSTRFHGY